MRIGCHISIARGFAKSVERAGELGANTFQYFPKNPRSYREKKVDQEAFSRAGRLAQERQLPTYAHASYLPNLSSPDDELRKRGLDSLLNELAIVTAFGSQCLVVHCGKHTGAGRTRGLQLMVESLNWLLTEHQEGAGIALENTAGQGSELGYQLETLLAVREQVEQPERLAFCLDTCHAFAAAELAAQEVDGFVTRLEDSGFLEHLDIIHLNDSQHPFAARKDRHAKLGQGEMGVQLMTELLNHPSLGQVPFIIETPVDDELEYADEIAQARAWAGAEG